MGERQRERQSTIHMLFEHGHMDRGRESSLAVPLLFESELERVRVRFPKCLRLFDWWFPW